MKVGESWYRDRFVEHGIAKKIAPDDLVVIIELVLAYNEWFPFWSPVSVGLLYKIWEPCEGDMELFRKIFEVAYTNTEITAKEKRDPRVRLSSAARSVLRK